jgi:hypothetical protein
MIVPLGWKLWSETHRKNSHGFSDMLLYVMRFLLAAAAYLALRVSRCVIGEEIVARIPAIDLGAWRYLQKLRLGEFLYMLRLRRTLLSVLANSVFMGRIRELIYRVNDRDRALAKKTAKGRIYDLLSPDPSVTTSQAPALSHKLKAVIQAAAVVATALWFDDMSQLSSLPSSSQVTLCHNLKSFLTSVFGADATSFPAETHKLWELLQLDWSHFNADPLFLLDASQSEPVHPD